MGKTSAASAQRITISENPNSVPDGMCPTTYGSKKIYSEIINKGKSNPTKIAPASTMYLGFEKTSLTVLVNLDHRVNYTLKN